MSGSIHASCVVLAEAAAAFGGPASAGVLLLGESGAGKSETALRLIERGARLVSDDRTELFVEQGKLMARAAKNLEGLLEIRGVGIVELPCVPSAPLALAVELGPAKNVHRLPEPVYYAPPATLGSPPELRIPLLCLSPDAAAPARIVAAAAMLTRTPAGPKIASRIL